MGSNLLGIMGEQGKNTTNFLSFEGMNNYICNHIGRTSWQMKQNKKKEVKDDLE